MWLLIGFCYGQHNAGCSVGCRHLRGRLTFWATLPAQSGLFSLPENQITRAFAFAWPELDANTGDTPRVFLLAPALAALPPVEFREWLYDAGCRVSCQHFFTR